MQNLEKRLDYAVADGSSKKAKIKTPFARIIVGGTIEKPCYDILYFDPTDRKYHVGFGSFSLEYVFKWLSEEFEIVEFNPEDDVKHGHWIDMQYDDATEGMWRCSECGSDRYFDIMTPTECGCYYCPNCGAKMDGERRNDDN